MIKEILLNYVTRSSNSDSILSPWAVEAALKNDTKPETLYTTEVNGHRITSFRRNLL
jgi:hypothetical protein